MYKRQREDIWQRTVAGLRQAGDLAAEFGITLAIENHSGTLTQTARDAVAMAQQVGRANVGILMDHYWVVAAGVEDPLQAARLQAPHVRHCHCKGLVYENGQPRATLLDGGEIDWLEVLKVLQEAGYEGFLSDEYEKFWRPELPEPEAGMARNAAYLRECVGKLGG